MCNEIYLKNAFDCLNTPINMRIQTFNKDKLLSIVQEIANKPIFYFTSPTMKMNDKTMNRFVSFCHKHELLDKNNGRPWLMISYNPNTKTYRIEQEYTLQSGTFMASFPNRMESLKYLPRFLSQSEKQLQEFILNDTCTICFEKVSNADNNLDRPYNACAICYNKICTECIFNIALSLTRQHDIVRCPFCRLITFTMTKRAVHRAKSNDMKELLSCRKNDFVIDYYV